MEHSACPLEVVLRESTTPEPLTAYRQGCTCGWSGGVQPTTTEAMLAYHEHERFEREYSLLRALAEPRS